MRYYSGLLILMIVTLPSLTWSGSFIGDPILFPEGCQQIKDQKRNAQKCRIKGLLTYISDEGDRWQIDEWKDGSVQSGLTDGASIPNWAEPLVGDRYDKSYLKAAIIHDHYCYKENRVRTWQQTHRMFYNALIDLKVNKVKAKAMYFAVYWKGPRWKTYAKGEQCIGPHRGPCTKSIITTVLTRSIRARYDDKGFDETLLSIQKVIEKNPEITIEALEKKADRLGIDPFLLPPRMTESKI